MFRQIPTALGLACLLASLLTSAQEQQQQPTQGDQKQALETLNLAGQQAKGLLMPMVNVDRDKNKSRVDVHVPLFFNMLNEKDDTSGKSKLDLSVMGGLVTVNRDKERDPSGALTGPLVVTVFGFPVYSGSASAKPPRPNSPDGSSSVKSVGEAIGSRNREIMAQISESIRETNERSLKSLAETFSRIAGSLNLGAQRAEAEVDQAPARVQAAAASGGGGR